MSSAIRVELLNGYRSIPAGTRCLLIRTYADGSARVNSCGVEFTAPACEWDFITHDDYEKAMARVVL